MKIINNSTFRIASQTNSPCPGFISIKITLQMWRRQYFVRTNDVGQEGYRSRITNFKRWINVGNSLYGQTSTIRKSVSDWLVERVPKDTVIRTGGLQEAT